MLRDLSVRSKALFRKESNGQPVQMEHGTNGYLQEELKTAREAIKMLDEAVSKAQSFREKATILLEESHRALSRLEQAMTYRDGPDLIVIACEISCAAKRGLTLVHVYGSYGTVVKVMTIMLRSLVNAKFDKSIEHLKSLLPLSEIHCQRDSSGKGQSQLTSSVSSHDLITRNPSSYQMLARTSCNSLQQQSTSVTPSGPPQGVLLRPNKHDRVFTMTFMPHTVKNAELDCIWWSTAQAVEFYSVSSQSTTSIPYEKPSHAVTAINVDLNGHSWTGHHKGTIRFHPKSSWKHMVEEKCFNFPVRCISFDNEDRVWIGDDSGRVKVVRFVESSSSIEVITCLQHSQRVLSKLKPHCSIEASKGLFSRFASAGALTQALSEASVRQGQSVVDGLVRAILVKGGRAWISGGKYNSAISLWNSSTFEEVDSFDCTNFGPCNAFVELPWADTKHQSFNSDVTNSPSTSCSQVNGSWRLISGHDNGQLLLWHPDHPVLSPLIRIGDSGSACRGIVVFNNYNIMASAHQNGELHIFTQITSESAVPPCAETVIGTFRPRKAILRVHKSSVERIAGTANSCVTCSQLGTIRLWRANELLQEAHRQGLLSGASSRTMDQSLSVLSRSSNPISHTRHASKESNDTQQSSDGLHFDLPSFQPSLPPMQFQTIESQELRLRKQIGAGAYGKVWLAEWTGVSVAVKELLGFAQGLELDPNNKEYQALMNEVHLLGGLSHPNIMRFMAFCVSPPMIVMQYYPHGSLFQLLQRALNGQSRALKELAWMKRLEMLKDVAAGMQYLHSRKPPVIHGDLRSPNLLLDLTIDHNQPRFHLKIADFGLARMLGAQGNSIAVSKTTNPRWTAPEVIKNSTLGKAADVYSFSIIMWEMLTWQQPYEDMMSVQVMFSTVTQDNRPDIPPVDELPGSPGPSLSLYLDLMKNCWQANPAGRPNFKEVVEFFQEMMSHERKVQPRGNRPNSMVPSTPLPAPEFLPAHGGGLSNSSVSSGCSSPRNNTGGAGPIAGAGASGSPFAQALVQRSQENLFAAIAENLGREGVRSMPHSPVVGAVGGVSMSPILEERHSNSLGLHEESANDWDAPICANRAGSYTQCTQRKASMRVRRTKTDDGSEYKKSSELGKPWQSPPALHAPEDVVYHKTESPFSAAMVDGSFGSGSEMGGDCDGYAFSSSHALAEQECHSSTGPDSRSSHDTSHSFHGRSERYSAQAPGREVRKSMGAQGRESSTYAPPPKQLTFSPFAAAAAQAGSGPSSNSRVSPQMQMQMQQQPPPQQQQQQRQYSSASTSSGGSHRSVIIRRDDELADEPESHLAEVVSSANSSNRKLKSALKSDVSSNDYYRQRSAPGSSFHGASKHSPPHKNASFLSDHDSSTSMAGHGYGGHVSSSFGHGGSHHGPSAHGPSSGISSNNNAMMGVGVGGGQQPMASDRHGGVPHGHLSSSTSWNNGQIGGSLRGPFHVYTGDMGEDADRYGAAVATPPPSSHQGQHRHLSGGSGRDASPAEATPPLVARRSKPYSPFAAPDQQGVSESAPLASHSSPERTAKAMSTARPHDAYARSAVSSASGTEPVVEAWGSGGQRTPHGHGHGHGCSDALGMAHVYTNSDSDDSDRESCDADNEEEDLGSEEEEGAPGNAATAEEEANGMDGVPHSRGHASASWAYPIQALDAMEDERSKGSSWASRHRRTHSASGFNVSWAEEKDNGGRSVDDGYGRNQYTAPGSSISSERPPHNQLRHSLTGTFQANKSTSAIAAAAAPSLLPYPSSVEVGAAAVTSAASNRHAPSAYKSGCKDDSDALPSSSSSSRATAVLGLKQTRHNRHVSSPSVHFSFDDVAVAGVSNEPHSADRKVAASSAGSFAPHAAPVSRSLTSSNLSSIVNNKPSSSSHVSRQPRLEHAGASPMRNGSNVTATPTTSRTATPATATSRSTGSIGGSYGNGSGNSRATSAKESVKESLGSTNQQRSVGLSAGRGGGGAASTSGNPHGGTGGADLSHSNSSTQPFRSMSSAGSVSQTTMTPPRC